MRELPGTLPAQAFGEHYRRRLPLEYHELPKQVGESYDHLTPIYLPRNTDDLDDACTAEDDEGDGDHKNFDFGDDDAPRPTLGA